MINATRFNGKRAALSLTYDDGMDCHLDLVGPSLEDHGFRGTFYTPVNATLMGRMDEWAALSQRGHELGNHTLFHPCRSYGGSTWIQPWRDLKLYDLARWEAEVDLANLILNPLLEHCADLGSDLWVAPVRDVIGSL